MYGQYFSNVGTDFFAIQPPKLRYWRIIHWLFKKIDLHLDKGDIYINTVGAPYPWVLQLQIQSTIDKNIQELFPPLPMFSLSGPIKALLMCFVFTCFSLLAAASQGHSRNMAGEHWWHCLFLMLLFLALSSQILDLHFSKYSFPECRDKCWGKEETVPSTTFPQIWMKSCWHLQGHLHLPPSLVPLRKDVGSSSKMQLLSELLRIAREW